MRKSLITGLIILMPLALTFLIFFFLIDLFTDPFLDITNELLIKLDLTKFIQQQELLTFITRIITIVFLFFLIVLLGFFARVFFLKSLINIANSIFSRIPFVKTIYNATKDIVSAFLKDKKERKAFQRPIITHFPTKKSKCVSFVSGEIPKCCQEKIKEPLTPVFVPTAPHPISGYLIMVPTKDLCEISMTNEEAIKFTVSCGMLTPEIIRENENATIIKNKK